MSDPYVYVVFRALKDENPVLGACRSGLCVGRLPVRQDFRYPLLMVSRIWVAVKELKLSYHNVDTWQIIWYLNYGNSSLTATLQSG